MNLRQSLSCLVLVFIMMSCNKPSKDLPVCIQDKITEWEVNVVCNSGGLVEEYLFQDENVYVFIDGSCGADFAFPVLNSTCEELGFLSGLIGNTMINGVVFDEEAEFLQNVWEQ